MTYWELGLLRPRCSTLHFASLKGSCHALDHLARVSRFVCKLEDPCGVSTIEYDFVSSANNLKNERNERKDRMEEWAASGNSFINIRKSTAGRGPIPEELCWVVSAALYPTRCHVRRTARCVTAACAVLPAGRTIQLFIYSHL